MASSKKSRSYHIGVIGLWHLGEIYSAGLPSLGHKVTGIDEDGEVVANLNQGIPPLPEPGLDALLLKGLKSGQLAYTADFREVGKCNVAWFALDTPVDAHDKSDLKPIFRSIRRSVPYFKNDVLIVVSSQLPAGTSRKICNLIKKIRPKLKFHYAYSPENLRLGEAIRCFLEPERVVVGVNDDETLRRVAVVFGRLQARIVRMSIESAEMVKHALNAFFAVSISFANDIADVSEATGADIVEVIDGLRSDARIGRRAALGAGLGFSGGTLGRDLSSLLKIGREHGISLPLIESAIKKNSARPAGFVTRLEKLLGGLKDKKIAIMGLTYKAGTTTLRRSRSLEVARLLLARGAKIVLCDPHISITHIPHLRGATVAATGYGAAAKARALVFLTPWEDFKALDFRKLAHVAAKNAILFDGTNFLYAQVPLIRRAGFRYYGVGR